MVPPAGILHPPASIPALPASSPVVAPGHVPLPVPDAAAPAAEPDGAANVHDGAGPAVAGIAGAGGSEGGIASVADPPPGTFIYADQLPERVFYVAPEYTDIAREAGIEGTVMLWALVDLDGSVKAVQVIRSVPLLDDAASAALRKWRFTPALASGRPVRVWVAVPVRFTLR